MNKYFKNFDGDYIFSVGTGTGDVGLCVEHRPRQGAPFVAISTSPYNKGDCCTEGGKVYRSTLDNNVWSPSAYPQGWEEVSV